MHEDLRRQMTVGELRALLAGLPDDLPVVNEYDDGITTSASGVGVREVVARSGGMQSALVILELQHGDHPM